jgi:hypothetical protein
MTNLWKIPEVPHKGWVEQTVVDMDDAIHTCEMCGKEEIRFVHIMEHANNMQLQVGCVCAEKMSNDYIGPKENLSKARLLSNNKRTWFNKSNWYKRYTDNYWRDTRTIKAVITPKKSGIYYWLVTSTNGRASQGYAYNLKDAIGKVEDYISKMQIK